MHSPEIQRVNRKYEFIQASSEYTFCWSPMFLFLEDSRSIFFNPRAYSNHPYIGDRQDTHQIV